MIFPQLTNQDGSIEADYVLIDKLNPLKTGTPIQTSDSDLLILFL